MAATSTRRATPGMFVAYVYPGWHESPYRPGVNEWELLDQFSPYFLNHQPPLVPLAGQYSDVDPKTAARQIGEACGAGIGAFTYFSYYHPDGFVLDEPARVALQEAEAREDFFISLTWCLRLPYASFPLPVSANYDLVGLPLDPPSDVHQHSHVDIASKFVDELTLSDVRDLIDEKSLIEAIEQVEMYSATQQPTHVVALSSSEDRTPVATQGSLLQDWDEVLTQYYDVPEGFSFLKLWRALQLSYESHSDFELLPHESPELESVLNERERTLYPSIFSTIIQDTTSHATDHQHVIGIIRLRELERALGAFKQSL